MMIKKCKGIASENKHVRGLFCLLLYPCIITIMTLIWFNRSKKFIFENNIWTFYYYTFIILRTNTDQFAVDWLLNYLFISRILSLRMSISGYTCIRFVFCWVNVLFWVSSDFYHTKQTQQMHNLIVLRKNK